MNSLVLNKLSNYACLKNKYCCVGVRQYSDTEEVYIAGFYVCTLQVSDIKGMTVDDLVKKLDSYPVVKTISSSQRKFKEISTSKILQDSSTPSSNMEVFLDPQGVLRFIGTVDKFLTNSSHYSMCMSLISGHKLKLKKFLTEIEYLNLDDVQLTENTLVFKNCEDFNDVGIVGYNLKTRKIITDASELAKIKNKLSK